MAGHTGTLRALHERVPCRRRAGAGEGRGAGSGRTYRPARLLALLRVDYVYLARPRRSGASPAASASTASSGGTRMLACRAARVVESEGSDHSAVVAEIYDAPQEREQDGDVGVGGSESC